MKEPRSSEKDCPNCGQELKRQVNWIQTNYAQMYLSCGGCKRTWVYSMYAEEKPIESYED